MRRFILAALSALSLMAVASPASAWIAAHGGGFWRGPAGGIHAWHGGYAAGGGYWHGGGCCWGGPGWGGAAAAGAVGLAAGAAIGAAAAVPPPPVVIAPAPVVVAAPAGATFYALPGGCESATVNGARYYNCAGTYYRPYSYGGRTVYQVVPPPF
ncbi:DUF6515 family protein [Chelatococcus reniformis]|uniref:Uncharacterized protein n=1 Tax=Chelatococcus reniformis TaxID=1494448 RepID=A0A916U8M0_9HYPH|nr:DUF6515 family protein [Chelatococcus reniformis]GGC63495.1 hypothetical protein GCM10010994_22630 [Chelatococcus reniformis]